MEGMKDEKFEGSENGDAKNGVLFIDLPFTITVILDLSALNLTAIMQGWSRVWASCIGGIRIRSS